MKSQAPLFKIRRIQGELESLAQEIYVGYLVDSRGNFLESPRILEPLCLAGENKRPVLLTRLVIDMEFHDGDWFCLTETGTVYKVRCDKVYH